MVADDDALRPDPARLREDGMSKLLAEAMALALKVSAIHDDLVPVASTSQSGDYFKKTDSL